MNLRRCPFCNQKDEGHPEWGKIMPMLELVDKHEPHFWVACRNCSASGPQKISPRHAIKAWNQRSTTWTSSNS